MSGSRTGSRSFVTRHGPALLVGLAACAAFLPGAGGGFVYDDHRFVERNESIRSLSNIADFLLDPRTLTVDYWEGIFRPLRTLSFAVDYAIWGLNPVGYHLQSVAWHLLASLMLLLLLRRLGLERGPATVAAALFAVHPVHAESVVWITSRSDVMSGALMLAALAYYARPATLGLRRMAGLLLLSLVAMLAKEGAVMLLPLCVLLDLAVLGPRAGGAPASLPRRERWKAHVVQVYLPLFLLTVFYVGFRQWRTRIYANEEQFGHMMLWWGGSYLGQLMVAARGFFFHVLSVLWPVGSRLDLYPVTEPRVEITVVLALLVAAGLVLLVIRTARTRPLVAAGLAWFPVALFPVSNLVFTVAIPSADRFLYVPLAGAALAFGATLRGRWLVPAGATVVIFGALAVHQCGDWADDATLWENAAPGSPRAIIHQGRVAYDAVLEKWKDPETREEALADIPAALAADQRGLDRVREIYQHSGRLVIPHSHSRMGNLHRLRKDRRLAYRSLKRAAAARKNFAQGAFIMGLLFQDVGDYLGARAEFLRAREWRFVDPVGEELGRVLNEQARLEFEEGSYGRALALLEESAREWPEKAGNRGVRAEIAKLRAHREQVRNEPPPPADDARGWLERGELCARAGLFEEALEILGGLHRSLPDAIPVIFALARWGYEESGDFENATRVYLDLLEREPRHGEARRGLVRCGAFEYAPALAGDPRRQLRLLEGLEETPRVLVLRARALRELGEKEKARPLLEVAAEGTGPGVMDAIHALWLDEDRAEREETGR